MWQVLVSGGVVAFAWLVLSGREKQKQCYKNIDRAWEDPAWQDEYEQIAIELGQTQNWWLRSGALVDYLRQRAGDRSLQAVKHDELTDEEAHRWRQRIYDETAKIKRTAFGE
jgi:hypothetical protein